MAPPASPLWWELSRVAQLLVDATVLAGLVALVVLALVMVGQLVRTGGPHAQHTRVHWWAHRRAVRAFVAAVTSGDIDAAEVAARQVLGGHDRPGRSGRTRVHSWDEWLILGCSWAQAAAELQDPDGLAAWCPTVRQVPDADGTMLVIGRHRPVRLRLRSQRWVPAEGIRFTADADGPVIIGHLTLRPAPPVGVDGDRVQVWVHAEGPLGRRSRRVLRAARRATRSGLQQWATQRSRPPDQHRWPG